MNKDSLNRIYNIEQEIKHIDSFLSSYDKKPRKINLELFRKKFRFSLRLWGYGFLSEATFVMSEELNGQILKVVKDYREKLIAEQNELWGSE
ncbi:hypothetical protein [Lactococcus petauri]|uniref:hypothetical protein n=1 Tax=Lactococcus petauri TaxID=1940789 RepID=UPI00254B08AC|nr:hypothetical protein [Lactococcus petauri]